LVPPLSRKAPAIKVLISGGAGYIGSTIAAACADCGIAAVIVDDLSTGSRSAAGAHPFFQGDCADSAVVAEIFAAHPDISAAIHCAARVSVPGSTTDPLAYYASNVSTSLAFAQQLAGHGCRRIIFSSTAAMYATSDGPVDESAALELTSPYAASKRMTERILSDAAASGALDILALRYFNPIGADPLLRTGPSASSDNVLDCLLAAHESDQPFHVTGTSWPTPDGSGVRDYVHVWDLACAHVAAIRRFDEIVGTRPERSLIINIGGGHAYSVYELIAVFEQVVGSRIRHLAAPARPGDVPGNAADITRARHQLRWQPQLTIADAVRDAIAWRRVSSRPRPDLPARVVERG
jgi:UDP-glucose 4-epimerase